MKKVAIIFLSAVLFLVGLGSASAEETELRKAINEVVGTPYKWGGTTTKGFDCSGFILYIFNQFDVKLPRTSKSQSQVGTKVAKDDLRPGDLVFFNTNGKDISHAGIYVGEGQFAHPSSSKGVSISKLSDAYYAKRYVTARRVATGDNYSEMIVDEHESDDVHVE